MSDLRIGDECWLVYWHPRQDTWMPATYPFRFIAEQGETVCAATLEGAVRFFAWTEIFATLDAALTECEHRNRGKA